MSHDIPESPELSRLLTRAGRRLRWQRCLSWACWGALFSVVAASLLVAVHRSISPDWLLMTPVVVLLASGPVLGALFAMIAPAASQLRTAVAIERCYALRERISSALLISHEAEGSELSGTHAEAVAALVRDGEKHASSVELTEALPTRMPRALLPGLGAALLFACTMQWFPELDLLGKEDQRQQDERQAKAVEERKKALKKRMQELRKLAKKEQLSAETRKLLTKLEKQQQKKPKQPGTERKKLALAELSSMRKDLKNRKDKVDSRLEQLRKVAKTIRDTGEQPQSEEVKRIESAMQSGDMKAATDAMRQLAQKLRQAAKSGMGEAEKQAMRKDLDRLMKKLKDSPSLQKKIAESLSKLEAGNLSDMSDKLAEAAGDLSDLERLMRESELLDRALDEVKYSEEELASLPQEWPEGEP